MWSSGQQRAVNELERIQSQSDGGFEFVVLPPEEKQTTLVVDISIRLGPMETRLGGLQLHEREDFRLHVPAGFPFDRPAIEVRHNRFEGFPHVIWSRWLCLYQANLEWNPAGGLFGFFERLNLWLGKAAINDMDPVEGPLEPPHHATDFTLPPFIVRANAPVPAGEQWLGLADLEPQTNRIDIVGWHSVDGTWPDGKRLAFAVFLPKALPMEFPTMGEELFNELLKQGLDKTKILHYLRIAALLAPVGEPVYLVIGLPMRRAADGTLRQHIAVWSVDAKTAADIRITVGNQEDTKDLQDIRERIADNLYKIFQLSAISWCQVLEDRQEIVVRRDANSHLAWFHGKRVLVLGCGALGSWVAEMLLRSGSSVIHLVDNGIVKPGLLTRQNYTSADIGANKANALHKRLQSIAPPGITIEPYRLDAHRFAIQNIEQFASYDVVVDCTASHIMQMKLERDWHQFSGRSPAIVSMVTDATAQQGLCVVTPRNSVSGPWEAYVRLKYRLCCDGMQQGVVAAFYDNVALSKLFQPEPGCSDLTFAGSMADSISIAAVALNLACERGLKPDKNIGFSFGIPGSGYASEEVVALDEMDEFIAGNYRVRISRRVGREARAWVRQNNRRRSSAHETGGLLWGMWDDSIGIIWIFDASGPPADSRHDPGHFLCGVDGTAAEHKRRYTSSRGTSGFVGYWHTHPDMPSVQSRTDIHGMSSLVSAIGQNQKRALMLIYGRSSETPSAGIYVYESQSVKKTSEFLKISEVQISLRTPVV